VREVPLPDPQGPDRAGRGEEPDGDPAGDEPIARQPTGGYLERPRPSGLADVIDIILDKGLVIDAYVRVSLIGIEILTIDARIVIASVDTYLRFAEAVGRVNIAQEDSSQGLPELMESMTEGGSKSKTRGAVEGVKEKLGIGESGDDEDERETSRPRRRTSSQRSRRAKDEDE
jgi:gas vesicle structural protein